MSVLKFVLFVQVQGSMRSEVIARMEVSWGDRSMSMNQGGWIKRTWCYDEVSAEKRERESDDAVKPVDNEVVLKSMVSREQVVSTSQREKQM